MQLILWCIYFILALLAQFAPIPIITEHEYFIIFMGVLLLIAFLSTLFIPMRTMRRSSVMWWAFGMLLMLRVTSVFSLMWHMSVPITAIDSFVVDLLGLYNIERIIRFFIDPMIILYQFGLISSTIDHIGYFYWIVQGASVLSLHISSTIIEITKIIFPVIAIILAIINRSRMPKIYHETNSEGHVLDDAQIEAQRRREEQELQRKLDEMYRKKEAEEQEENGI